MTPKKPDSMDLFARMRRKVPVKKEQEPTPAAAVQAVKAMARRAARAAESIMENERLTADLDDDAAKVLIAWGIVCAKRVVGQTTGMDDAEAEEAMYPGLGATRRLMRTINNWIAKGREIGREERVAYFDKVIEHATNIYGEDLTPPTSERRDTFLGRHLADTPPQLIASLRAFVEDECVAERGSSNDQEKHEKKDIHAFD
jgi:hypothetical protein